MDVCHELGGVFRVELQHLKEPTQADVLEVTVGQRLDICVGLDDLFFAGQVGTDEISFTYEESGFGVYVKGMWGSHCFPFSSHSQRL